jgi:hypothetical protein
MAFIFQLHGVSPADARAIQARVPEKQATSPVKNACFAIGPENRRCDQRHNSLSASRAIRYISGGRERENFFITQGQRKRKMKSSWRIVTGVVWMAGVACAADVVLPSVDFSKMATTGPAWSAATNVDGHACRLLAGGERGVVAIPAWWPEGNLRPPTGSAWRAEVEFKDTATAPIIVSIFAALPGSVELHRIGGTGDGAWHTALVPVPWDMVARVAGSARTELTLAPPGGAAVAVASVRITTGNAIEDEARWDAETRAWTARVQDAKRAQAQPPPAQACEILTSGLLQGPLSFVRPWGDLIESTSAPQTSEVGVERDRAGASGRVRKRKWADAGAGIAGAVRAHEFHREKTGGGRGVAHCGICDFVRQCHPYGAFVASLSGGHGRRAFAGFLVEH